MSFMECNQCKRLMHVHCLRQPLLDSDLFDDAVSVPPTTGRARVPCWPSDRERSVCRGARRQSENEAWACSDCINGVTDAPQLAASDYAPLHAGSGPLVPSITVLRARLAPDASGQVVELLLCAPAAADGASGPPMAWVPAAQLVAHPAVLSQVRKVGTATPLVATPH